MIKPFCTRSGWPRFSLTAFVLGLLLLVVLAPASRGDDPPPRLTPEKRKELGRQATDLNHTGVELYQRGDLGPATAKIRKALAIYERLYTEGEFPHGQPDLAASLNNLGRLLQDQGAYAEARGYLERALAMRQTLYAKERYPQGQPSFASSLNNLGMLLKAQGAYGEARVYLERALAMRRDLYPKDRFPLGHPDLATSLDNLGVLLEAQGAYAEARGYYERALAMDQALYPKDKYPRGHPDLAASLNNLGELLEAQGAYGEARVYLERALAMDEAVRPNRQFPQGHPDLAGSLSNLGELLQAQGAYSAARRYLERALAMDEALYPKDRFPRGHPDLATSLSNMGGLLHDQGAYADAQGYWERALAMREALYPKNLYPQGHPEVAVSLYCLGALIYEQGVYAQAREYLERALAMFHAMYPNDRFPRGHPDLANSLNWLGVLLQAQGVYAEARPVLQQAVDMQQDLADILLAATSESEARNYLAQLPMARDGLISVSLHVPDSDDATYVRVWRGKAVLTRVLQQRQAALFPLATADVANRRALETWRDTRRQLARLMLATSDGRDRPERLKQVEQLTADKERLERQLAGAIPEFARQKALEQSSYSKLVEALPDRTVVLDLVQFTRFEQDPQVKGKKGERQTQSYIGYVLARGRPVRQIDLGPAPPIDDAADLWRRAIVAGQPSPAAETLRRLVWEPLAKQFPRDTNTVIIAPDGRLTAIPWAALPGDRPGTLLLEQYALATVPHAPFLLDRLTAPARTSDDRDVLLAVGGVAYDRAPKPVDDEKTRIDLLASRLAETERGRGDGWKELPGTLQELNVSCGWPVRAPWFASRVPSRAHCPGPPGAAPRPLGAYCYPRLLCRPQHPLGPPARPQALQSHRA